MRRGTVLICALLMGVGLAWGGTTGQIKGTVSDQSGEPLPGAQVTIESSALIGGPRTVVAGVGGNFVFPGIAPGAYSVKVTLDTFVPQELDGVRVALDQTTTLQFQMVATTFKGEVTVNAEAPVVNVAETSVNQTYNANFLQGGAVGSENRWIGYAAFITPGAQEEGNTGGLSFLGSSGAENSYYIDGLSDTNPVTADPTVFVNFDAIQEMAVETGGYEAEFGNALGGLVNIVTKSGGNQFSGSVDVRYYDGSFATGGDHFDPDQQPTSFTSYSGTLGGPILRDKLWFFASYENRKRKSTEAGAPYTRSDNDTGVLGKLTWQPGDVWRVVWKGDYFSRDGKNLLSPAVLYEPEAQLDQPQDNRINQLEALGVLSPSLFLSLQAGYTDSSIDVLPKNGYETISHVDLATGVLSRNFQLVQLNSDTRKDFRGDLSWYVDQLGGSHEFKFGIGASNTGFDFNFWIPGSYIYLDMLGQPFALYQQVRPRGIRHYDGRIRTAYVQDAWQLHRNLTINVGVRHDQATYDNAAGDQVADLKKFQPRIGLAWDATGDGKTAVKGFWGRFMDPAALQLPTATEPAYGGLLQYVTCAVAGIPDTALCEALAPSIGSAFLADPGDYPGTGWLLAADVGSNPSLVDPNLKPAYADQWVVGVEREVYRNTSLGLQYIDKKTKDLWDDTCAGNIPTPTPGADCSYKIIANLAPLKRDYKGWMLTFESRAWQNAHILASYVYSESKGSIEYTWGQNTDFDFYPLNWVNRYGYLNNDRRHQIRINGYWLLPYRFMVGFDVNWASPFRWTPQSQVTTQGIGTEYLEPRGSREGADRSQTDLQVSKSFAVGGTWNLELIGSIVNVFSSEQATSVCVYDTGCGGTIALGDALTWQQPRRYELGARVTF